MTVCKRPVDQFTVDKNYCMQKACRQNDCRPIYCRQKLLHARGL